MGNTMGKWLQTMRKRHHMQQKEFLDALGQYYSENVAISTLSGWEGGKNPPIEDSRFVEAVARVFNVSVAEVLRGSGYDLGTDYDEIDETKRLLLEAYDSGNLARLIQQALEAHAAREARHARLASVDEDSDAERADDAARSASR